MQTTLDQPAADPTPAPPRAGERCWLEDAALRRGISVRTLYRLRAEQRLQFYRSAGNARVVVDMAELDRALEARPVKSKAKPA